MISSFFHSFDFPTTDSKKKNPRRPSSRPTTSPSSSNYSDASTQDPAPRMEGTLKRISFTALHSPKSSSRTIPQQHATLDLIIESPPLVFYGVPESSSGALFSGQLKFLVHDDSLAVESFKLKLAVAVTMKKPFHAHCQDCAHQTNDINSWNFLQEPTTFQKGEHSFPFSFLLPGHLPASMKGSLSTIEYVLRANVTTATGEPITLSQVIDIKRAVRPPENLRKSIRVFPPTNLTATCELPPVIHPIGEFTMAMHVDGIVNRTGDGKTQTQWRLKRMTWRLDETQKVIAPACAKHAAKLGTGPDVKKGTAHQDVRTVGADEIKTGWKSDYSTPDGSLDVEFPFGIRADAQPVCDLKSEDGTEVSHQLVVEMVVAEEFAPIGKPKQVTPTGSARVLRMHFNIIVTERSGLGISWDEEQPPLYENVPASPPTYGNAVVGPPIPDYDDLSPLDPQHPTS